ncbi:MAG: tetratricopeptide repeat protein [Reyranella sp.]|jgi:tetratricopeptide (TPR) repeat protein|nr:tetratricopeptide repeat protein [Reyranella sp.]
MRPTVFAAVAILALGLPIATFAAGGGADPPRVEAVSKPVDPAFAQAKAMIQQKNYAGAMPLLQQVVQKDPRNADAYNLMGYATRSSGNPNGSLQYYQQALAIDPKHIGANEYLGEAYLMLDRPAEADQMLARLDSLCVFGCTEYRQLKAAIANYKQGKKPTN